MIDVIYQWKIKTRDYVDNENNLLIDANAFCGKCGTPYPYGYVGHKRVNRPEELSPYEDWLTDEEIRAYCDELIKEVDGRRVTFRAKFCPICGERNDSYGSEAL